MRAIPIAPLCLSVFVVAAQAPYAKIIQHPGNPLYARVYNADVSSEGRIVTLGSAELGSSVTVYNDSALAQWAKRLAPASVTTSFIPLQVQWMPNNDILLTGFVQIQPNGRNIGMMRLDAYGDVLWTEMFQVSNGGWTTSDEARALALSSGDIAVLSRLNSNLALSKFDANGQHLWSRAFPDYYAGELYRFDIQEFSNGDLLVRDASTAIRTDATGNVLWGYSYDLPGAIVSPPYVYLPRTGLLADGGFVIQSIVDYYPALVRLDNVGTIVWAKKYDYGDFYQPWFPAVTELPGGDILAFPTSTWNRTIGLRIDQSGEPLSRCGVSEDFRLWPGSSAYWPKAFAGSWNGVYHFVGSVEQVINGGFFPPQTLLLRLDEDLLTPCASAIGSFTSADITAIPPPFAIGPSQPATCSQWSFAHDLEDITYTTWEACPLLVSVEERHDAPDISIFPSIQDLGQPVTVSSAHDLGEMTWTLLDMSGRSMARGFFATGNSGSIPTASVSAAGMYSLVILDPHNTVMRRARIILN